MKKVKSIKKKHALPSKAKLRVRIALTTLFLSIMSVFLVIRLINIAVFKNEVYSKAVLENMTQLERRIEAPRGTIQDINGRTMAASVMTYNIVLSPYDIVTGVKDAEKRENIYNVLATQLKLDVDEVKAEIERRAAAETGNRYYMIAENVDSETAEPLKPLEGVTVARTYQRNYPNGQLAAQVLGFYNGNDEGQYGIEEEYNTYLEGQAGRIFYQTEKYNISSSVLQEPVPGATITLTLDSVVQKYVEDAMKHYIDEVSPKSATAIIMNPKTGEILAMYSYPSFNPNTYNDLSKELGAKWSKMTSEEQTNALYDAWKNHAIQINYEPGSTFKPLIVAMALEEGLISKDATYNCTGSKVVADRTIKCWHREGHGIQTLSEALANSCNIALMEIGTKMDSKEFLQYVKSFGFGEKTGIALAGEEKGQLHDTLGPVEQATYCIGQGLTVTPIQLISAFSSVINGGYLMEPYVVSQITGADGKVLMKKDATVNRQIISSDIANYVREALKKVVDEGTGTKAAISGYQIGGKTGTGQIWKTDEKGKMVKDEKGQAVRDDKYYDISFMGFAPVDDPEVVGLIVFEKIPEHTGAQTLAFKEMMENIFPYLGIPTSLQTDTEDETVVTVPDVVGMSIYDAVAHLNRSQLKYTILGSGLKVDEQYPTAGARWDKNGNVTLYAKTDKPDQLMEVPNLVGKTIQEANTIVSGMFTISGNGSGKITSQFPAAGYKIEANNKIIVQTSE